MTEVAEDFSQFRCVDIDGNETTETGEHITDVIPMNRRPYFSLLSLCAEEKGRGLGGDLFTRLFNRNGRIWGESDEAAGMYLMSDLGSIPFYTACGPHCASSTPGVEGGRVFLYRRSDIMTSDLRCNSRIPSSNGTIE